MQRDQIVPVPQSNANQADQDKSSIHTGQDSVDARTTPSNAAGQGSRESAPGETDLTQGARVTINERCKAQNTTFTL